MKRLRIKNAIPFALFLLSVAALVAALAAPLGKRAGLWNFYTGFDILDHAATSGFIVAAASLVYGAGVIWFGRRARSGAPGQGRPLLWAALGLAVGAATFAYPFYRLHIHHSAPPIHDITTDTEEPPAFVASLELRPANSNTTVYAGEPVAVMQRVAYPYITPIVSDMGPEAAFERALRVARDLGWEVTAEAPEEGRIEAVDTTLWFGFKDDVVIRIRHEGEGSRVDVRSVSRVGKSDGGTNARRVGRFIDSFNDR